MTIDNPVLPGADPAGNLPPAPAPQIETKPESAAHKTMEALGLGEFKEKFPAWLSGQEVSGITPEAVLDAVKTRIIDSIQKNPELAPAVVAQQRTAAIKQFTSLMKGVITETPVSDKFEDVAASVRGEMLKYQAAASEAEKKAAELRTLLDAERARADQADASAKQRSRRDVGNVLLQTHLSQAGYINPTQLEAVQMLLTSRGMHVEADSVKQELTILNTDGEIVVDTTHNTLAGKNAVNYAIGILNSIAGNGNVAPKPADASKIVGAGVNGQAPASAENVDPRRQKAIEEAMRQLQTRG